MYPLVNGTILYLILPTPPPYILPTASAIFDNVQQFYFWAFFGGF